MSSTPDHRFRYVQGALQGRDGFPEEPRMQQLYALLSGSEAAATIRYAYDLYNNLEHRIAVDAFFLASTPRDLISTTLAIPVEVLDVYSYLFMDVSVFRNKLEILTYAKDYAGGAHAKEMMRTAATVGSEYLLWMYGNPDTETVDSRYIVRRVMVDSYFRGLAHKGNPLTSAMAKEAKSWLSMSISNAALIEKIDPRTAKAAVNELRIAIEGKDTTVAPEQAPVPIEEILH